MKRKSQLVSSFLLATLLALGVGCAKKADDGKISIEIQGKFSQDSGLSTKQLTVQANDGVVTLGGVVDNDAQREAASRQAASVAGVKQVINNLQVGSAPVASVKPPAATSGMAASGLPSSGTPSSATPGSTPARPAKAKNRVDRKNRSARTSEESNSADSDNDSDSANADNQTASATTPPSISEIPANHTAAFQTAPPPAPRKLIIDQGTQLAVRLVDPIDSEKNQTGDTFHATLNAPLTSDGEQAVPAGTELKGHLVEVKSAGKFAGQSAVVLQLDSLSSGGQTYSLQTDQYRKEGKSRGKNTAEKVGGGAIIGGIIGAIAGGGKGAAIGSAAGAGVGGGVQAASKSEQIKLPSETVLNFTLQAPITVVQAASPDASRPKLEDSHD